jgi:hypothetical protein
VSARHRAWFACVAALVIVVTRPMPVEAQDPDPDLDPAAQAPMGITPFTIQGFGDINYLSSTLEDEFGGFKTGSLDLFVTSRLGNHWSVVVEIVFEAEDNAVAVDLERFRFTYEHSDAFRVSAGRFHNPLLRWPVTSHHGLFNQTPIESPIIARWEDDAGLWPMHFVGLLAQGRFRNAAGLRYSFGVGNGRGTAIDEIQVTGDANRQRAMLASVGIGPDALPGLEVYASAYFDQIPAVSGSLRERDATLSASYLHRGIELRSEVGWMKHRDETSGITHETTGWYVLGAYRLPPGFAGLTPYVLLDKLNAAEGEAYLEGIPDEETLSVGLRWDATRWIALKGDYRWRKVAVGARSGAVRAQLAVNF